MDRWQIDRGNFLAGWLAGMIARKPGMLVAIAQATKMAQRI